jgi:hypothetical protein
VPANYRAFSEFHRSRALGAGTVDNDNKHEVAAYELQLSHLPVEEHFVPSVICDSSKSIFYRIRKVAAPVRLRSPNETSAIFVFIFADTRRARTVWNACGDCAAAYFEREHIAPAE